MTSPATTSRLGSTAAPQAADGGRALPRAAQDAPDADGLAILGIAIRSLERDEGVASIRDLLHDGGPHQVVIANAHTLNCAFVDPSYREILRGAALVLRDDCPVNNLWKSV